MKKENYKHESPVTRFGYWEEGGNVAAVVMVNIIVKVSFGSAATCKYSLSLIHNVKEEGRNMYLKVVRDGRHVEVSIRDIVVGDVIPLNIGDQVPACGILITAQSLSIDTSRVNGDSNIVSLHASSGASRLKPGWKIADGSGTMLVTSVGICTKSELSQEIGNKTTFKEVLNAVATSIGNVGLAVAFIAMMVLLLRWFTGHNLDGSPKFIGVKTKPRDVIEEVNQIIIIAFTIAVAAVPQGLPLAVTLIIVSATKRMVADNAFVRRPIAFGNMAFAKNLLCDKTVLTLNEMSVVQACAGGKKIDPSDNNTPYLSLKLSSLLTEGIAQNTEGNVYVPESGGVDVSGSAIEKAILRWGIKLGMNFEDIRSQSSVFNVAPFNSEKKRGAVALRLPDSQVRVHWKGVPEILLCSCTNYIDANDHLVAMNDDKLMFFRKAIDEMAAGGLDCLAIAYRSYEFQNVPTDPELLAQWELPEDDLVLLAIVGIGDLSQPGVKEKVQLCQRGGVKVRMVTRDNLPTAKATALECGILDSDADANMPNDPFDGRVFREMTDGQRQECAQGIKVMAWCSPDVKILFVQALKKIGEMVAVTGNVTDDADALHQADIGFAMGIRGTGVAKESSDIIILDDNFATCVKAFKWGRSVHPIIIKFMQLQLTVNVVALTTNFMAAVFYGHVPLNAVQLLWVNLLIVALVPLSSVTKPPADELTSGLLIEPGQPVKRYVKWKKLLFQGVYQIVAILIINFQGRSLLKSYNRSHAIKVNNTMIFNTFVVCQIIHQLGARKKGMLSKPKKWITSNYLFMGIAGTILISQFIIIEFLGKAFSTVALNLKEWQFSLTLGFSETFFAIILFMKDLTTHKN
ncbi:calcium-transporting ATPase 8, plasma membrane-type-like [Prunus persica]|uniref:calcium-transporting ATPase 8, plasma membrane-type-like n=1 Tax=Prunus persica TaxID=3760 RepID=UPI0009AB32BF|nr:calcium-transporting ATPase 8, plasma membrane-type-like [Prunus persica]